MSFEMKNFRRKRSEVEDGSFLKDIKLKTGRETPASIQFDAITEKENLRLIPNSFISNMVVHFEAQTRRNLLETMMDKEKRLYGKGKISPGTKSVFSEEELKLYNLCNRLLGKNLEAKSNIEKIVPTLLDLKKNIDVTEDLHDKSKSRIKEILVQKSKMAFEIDEKLIELRKLIKKKNIQYSSMQSYYSELQKRRQLMSSQNFKTLKERVWK
jgi:hypothetical protein